MRARAVGPVQPPSQAAHVALREPELFAKGFLRETAIFVEHAQQRNFTIVELRAVPPADILRSGHLFQVRGVAAPTVSAKVVQDVPLCRVVAGGEPADAVGSD